ncbi:hypothetical protein TNCV_2358001 [Trichonephila clavipes]|nr:hypothetical protein TNCV_2358001 [Trichonephila clavipes]
MIRYPDQWGTAALQWSETALTLQQGSITFLAVTFQTNLPIVFSVPNNYANMIQWATHMSSRHHIDDFMRGRIIGKIEEGRKITDVAREFDIAHSVVSRLWKSFKTTVMCSRRHGEVVL